MPDLAKLKPVYLVYGQERLLLEDAVSRLKARLAAQGDLDFNYDVFRGDADRPEAILAAAQTLPFMSEKRLVVVRDVHLMHAEAQKTLAAYVADSSPDTVFVMVAEKMAKNSVLYKAVEKARGTIHQYEAPKKSEYPAWIRGRLAERGKKVTAAAAGRIFEVIGEDLGRLTNEIEKICLYHLDKASLDTEDVDAVLTATTQASIFELTDSLGSRNSRRALRTLENLAGRNEPVPAIYHMVVRHMRMLLATKALLERGVTHTGAIARELKTIPFVAGKYREQSRNFTAQQLRSTVRDLVDIDFRVKSGRAELRTALEQFVVRIAG